MTPGIHPHNVKIKTIKIEPQPLSRTEKGGKIIDNKTLQKLKLFLFKQIYLNEIKISLLFLLF